VSAEEKPYFKPSTKLGWFLTGAVPSSFLLLLIGTSLGLWPLVVGGLGLFVVYAILDRPYKSEFSKEATLRMSKDLMGIEGGGLVDDSQNKGSKDNS